MIDTPGIYTLSLADYLADPCPEPSLDRTTALVLSERAPRHAWTQHPRLNPAHARTDSGAFDLGTAFHAWLLEGADVFAVIAADDWKKKAAQKARAEARLAGKVPLLTAQREAISKMGAAVMRALADWPHDDRPIPFRNGKPEQSLIWQTRGVWCRARPDWLTDDYRHVWDLKTTGASAHPSEWTRTLFSTGADIQHAMIRLGLHTLVGVDADVRFFVVETEPPYGVTVCSLDPEAQEFAKLKLVSALDTWRECVTTGKWPSYSTRCAYAEVPPWLKAKWELRAYYP